MIITVHQSQLATPLPSVRRRSIADLLAPLEKIANQSPNLVANHDARFKLGCETYELPRYIFVGPKGGDTPIHVGIFAGIHGDEPEGPRAIVQFIKMLEVKTELAAGYCLSFYPVCNPTGLEDGTHFSRNGKNLNREFWKNSSEPEVRLLQAELASRSFRGIISLHTDDMGDGFYGYSRGTTLAKHLLRQTGPLEKNEGVLSAPPKARPRHFENTCRSTLVYERNVIYWRFGDDFDRIPGVHRVRPQLIKYIAPISAQIH